MATRSAPLNEEVVADLRHSRQVVGELLPVIVDQHGRVINGRHRNAAGWKSRVVRPVKDDLEYATLRLHFLAVQRQASEAERAEAIGLLCSALEGKGFSGADLTREVVGRSPLNRTDTYEYIPDRFKRSGGYQGRASEIRDADFTEKTRVVEGVEVSAAPLPSDRQVVVAYPCPRCGCPGPH